MYRILVVPGARDGIGGKLDLDSEINLLLEISEQFDNLEIDIVGEATEILIARQLTLSTIAYDAVHWLGHADDDGFHLSSGEILPENRVRNICVDAGARTVFLNACQSARIGQYLANNKIAVVLCYSVAVLDRDAILNAMRFYSALARSSDPFHDGLREAYIAADPGDGTLLWLTNGQYVQEIIKPILERLDELAGRHDSTFVSFGNALTVTRGAFKSLDNKLSIKFNNLVNTTKHTRMALVAAMIVILLCTLSLVWAASSFSTMLAAVTATVEEPGSIPPTPTTQPTRVPTMPSTPTWTPATILSTQTWTPVPTSHPTVTPQSTWTPVPTVRPTETQQPTSAPVPTPRPTATRQPTWAPVPTVRSTSTLWPTVPILPLPIETPTLTPIEQAVQATLTAINCVCR